MPGEDAGSAGTSREQGTVVATGHLELELENGKIVRLIHPGEIGAIRGYGTTPAEASQKGRLYDVTTKICKDCGTLHEEARIYDTRMGFGFILWVAMAIILLLGFSGLASWFQAMVVGLVSLILIHWVRSVVINLQWRYRNAELAIKQCRRCQGKELVTLGRAEEKMTCPSCGAQNMQLISIGKS